MSIAEDFKSLIAERPNMQTWISDVQETTWGCSYTFNGFMNCCIVFEKGKYVDVQDVIDDWAPWGVTGHGPPEVWTRFDSVLSLVLNMERVLTP